MTSVSDSTGFPSGTPGHSDDPSGTERVAMRSDPPWLALGIVGVSTLIVLFSLAYFRWIAASRPPLGLAVIPAFCVATFVSAVLAVFARRRGGSLWVEVSPWRVVLQGVRDRSVVIDRTQPFGAMLLRDRDSRRHVLVLSQEGRWLMVLDLDTPMDIPTGWETRTLTVDLSAAALSPASPFVVTVAQGVSLNTLLRILDTDAAPDADRPLVLHAAGAGTLCMTREVVSVGARQVHVGKGALARWAGGPDDVTGLSLVDPEHDSVLLTTTETAALSDTESRAGSADAAVPGAVLGAFASRFGLEPPRPSRRREAYRG